MGPAWIYDGHTKSPKKKVATTKSTLIDASIVRAHQHAAGARRGQFHQSIGRSRGGLSTKIHAIVDSFGYPLKFVLTGGHEHEARVAPRLLTEISKYLLADKGYDSNEIRNLCACNNMTPVIPGRKCRYTSIDYDKAIYKERNVIERFFAKIKQFRRIATRYDKTEVMFLGSLTMASILIWLKV